MTITFVLALLKIRFVSLDHLEIAWIRCPILLIHACPSLALHARYNVVSSAYCKHSLYGVIWDISVTHRLNNMGPNIEPCGTPNSDVKRVETLRQFVQNAVEKLNNSLSNIKSFWKSWMYAFFVSMCKNNSIESFGITCKNGDGDFILVRCFDVVI